MQLRPWHIEDLNSLVKYANNWNIAKYLTNFFPYPYTEEDGRNFIQIATANNPINRFAIEVDGEAVGGIGVHPQTDIFEKNIELGYWLAEPFWGRGIMSQAVAQMIDFAFENYDVERIYATTFATNIASQRVLEKNNFIQDAHLKRVLYKNGEFEDELIYAFRRETGNLITNENTIKLKLSYSMGTNCFCAFQQNRNH